jgi:hypothetical protein
MKASEIITDDIVSRDKRKPAKDVVGKRVPNDYFGNRAEIKKRDRDLLSKEEFKKKQKQWFESEQLDEASDRTEIIIRKNTIPQDQGFRRKLDRFFSMVDAELSNEPERISDRAVLLTVPGNKVERVIHVLSELGIDVSRAKSLAEDDPCWKNYQQVGMKKKDGREVPNCVPKANVKEVADTDQDKYNETVEEETMKQAAKNPSGARFGGYYGATQRGAPRRGQGFGS